ncbi:hypothetical protein [uncultured Erythrobacter sp.]|uniref:hypothetical protein n=1 Tax=uncultured Erythrobacter sp. TaxID=263913 RepID=UPI0026364278|nr:hypothetical protein [uncultured Erythrobacter sp.]
MNNRNFVVGTLTAGILVSASILIFADRVFQKFPGINTDAGAIAPDASTGVGRNFGNNPRSYINCLESEEREGVPDTQGRDPNLCSNGKFAPKYFHVIYMKFGDPVSVAKLNARHAYFPASKSKDDDDVVCAIEFLRRNGGEDCGAIEHPRLGKIRSHFDEIYYGSQQRVYVFVDNTDIAFNPTTPMVFTDWGAHDDQFRMPRPIKRHPNLSFGGAELGGLGNSSHEGLYYENYFKDEDGNDMASSNKGETSYSINFNLLMCEEPDPINKTCDIADPKKVIPIAVDPDSGNGRPRRP